MKITLVRDDNMVVVDGDARYVDLSTMPDVIHAVQYDSTTETGEIEYDVLQGGENNLNVPINNVNQFQARFQAFVDAWAAGGSAEPEPPLPTPPDEQVENTYNLNKAYQVLIDYLAEQEARPSSALLADLKARALL
jgi:hypothetical protein